MLLCYVIYLSYTGQAPKCARGVIRLPLSASSLRSLLLLERHDLFVFDTYMYMYMYVAKQVPRQLVYGHFVYDTSSTDISSTDISSTTVYKRQAQLYIELLFQKIIIFINSNLYLNYDSFLSIPLPLTL